MSINYSEVTDEEALDILQKDFGEKAVEGWWQYIESPSDVLYYADAYGDLEGAVKLQPFDKTLPTQAHKGLLESGLDLLEAVNCHDMDTMFCPDCGSEMWEFEIHQTDSYTSTETVDEYGNTDSDFLEYVAAEDGPIWNPQPGEKDAPYLCAVCSVDTHRDFPNRLGDSGSVVVHYGETDEISAFSLFNDLIRWDYESHMGFRNNRPWTDLYGLPVEPESWVIGSLEDAMAEEGWDSIHWKEMAEDVGPIAHRKYRVKSEVWEILREWAEGDETHPDLDFTYIIDNTSYGPPKMWVADENRDALLAEIVEQVERHV